MKNSTGAVIALTGVGVAVALTWGLWGTPHVAAVTPQEQTLVPSAMAVLTNREPMPAATVTNEILTPTKVVSKSAEFDRLAGTGNPSDALRAYRIAANCQHVMVWQTLLKQSPNAMTIQEHIASLPKVEDACGDLSPGQRASRAQYIAKASLAGVHGALANLIMFEGPQGLLHTYTEDDPAWKRLEHDAVEASLATADPDALLTRAGQNTCKEEDPRACKPSPESLRDWVASQESRALDQGKPVPVFDPNRYATALTLEVAKQAIADGHTIVAAARRQQ